MPCLSRLARPEDLYPLFERTARLNPLSPDRAIIYFMLGRMAILLGHDNDAIEWLQRALHDFNQKSPTELAARDPSDVFFEATKFDLGAAYALTGQIADAHQMVASALASPRTMDETVRAFINMIPNYFDAHRRAQEMRIAEGLRLAGLREHLDEKANSYVTSIPTLWNNVPTAQPP